MSDLIPVFFYPGGDQIDPINLPRGTIFKWADNLGGGILDGPIPWGTRRPDGKFAHTAASSMRPDGIQVVEYHFAGEQRKRFDPKQDILEYY
ncbi:hypothetical protein QJ854_gp958 [Moumouvirus goulette]|uniref:Uncharacterized protein n=1 Tax=Moumouvirus goulette TaxID=1247379 RepID=M1PAC4_9VIRU|nr:hypothetical protein QJ854_gp958 [Moumouvirus goulette]AGF84824.1 hypothetical protein glt_00015 [Moumouvirus goulette]